VESVIEMTARTENHVDITLVVTCTDDQITFKKIYAEVNFDCKNIRMLNLAARTSFTVANPERLSPE